MCKLGGSFCVNRPLNNILKMCVKFKIKQWKAYVVPELGSHNKSIHFGLKARQAERTKS